MINVDHFELGLDDFLIVVDRVFHQSVDVLDFAFELIFWVFKAVVKGDHFGLDFVNGSSGCVFEEVVFVLLGFDFFKHERDWCVDVFFVFLEVLDSL